MEYVLKVGESLGTSLITELLLELGAAIYKTIKRTPNEYEVVNKIITKRLAEKCAAVIDTDSFYEFIQAQYIRELFFDFFNYKIYGIYAQRISTSSYKKSHPTTLPATEKELVVYLSLELRKVFERKRENSIVSIPEEFLIQNTIKEIFNSINDYFSSVLSKPERLQLYLSNERLDRNTAMVLNSIEWLKKKLEHCMQMSFSCINEDYSEITIEYMKKMKDIFSSDHVYLMDKFEINNFYVCPQISYCFFWFSFHWAYSDVRRTIKRLPMGTSIYYRLGTYF